MEEEARTFREDIVPATMFFTVAAASCNGASAKRTIGRAAGAKPERGTEVQGSRVAGAELERRTVDAAVRASTCGFHPMPHARSVAGRPRLPTILPMT